MAKSGLFSALFGHGAPVFTGIGSGGMVGAKVS
jgi:hypothetical protein